jgi:hypothetical protein
VSVNEFKCLELAITKDMLSTPCYEEMLALQKELMTWKELNSKIDKNTKYVTYDKYDIRYVSDDSM